MDLVEIVAERTGTSQGRAKIYVEMAKQRALAHTNRTVYITAMDFCVADLACAMYFREGMAGESSHSEGGITSTFQSSTYDSCRRNRSRKEAGGEPMRLSALKNYPVYEPVIEKDGEGVTTEKWIKRKSMLLEVWPASGKLQAEMYGERLNYILNMILPKNKDDDFRPTEKWGVNVYNQSIDEPDYRIISMKEYNRHYLYELEKIIK